MRMCGGAETHTTMTSTGPIYHDDAGQVCVPNVIGGKPLLLPSSTSFPVISAKSGKTVHYGQTASVEVANQAVEAAWQTFRSWRKTPVHERRRLLLRAAQVFEEKAQDAANRQMLETSCDESWAQFTAMQTSAFCSEVAGNIASATVGMVQNSYFGNTSLVFKEPRGPALIIPPWNAAVVLSTRAIANALASGCTVVLKASELCPWTHHLVMEAFHEAGFPPGAINLVMADRPSASTITETLIAHPSLRIVEFIGSESVGRIIGGLAAKHLKPIIMELGDQSPVIVMDDADLSKAVKVIAPAIQKHHGQVCFSTERIIVHSSVKEEFSRLLVDAFSRAPGAGSAVTRASAEKGKALVDAAIQDGAQFLCGSSDMVTPSSLSASILLNVKSTSKISTGESFIPTAFLVEVGSEEEAIMEANSRSGGLSSAIWTQNYERGIRMSRDMEFGMVQINGSTLFAEPSGPVQGIKGSGWGSNNGRYGIEGYLFTKAVSLPPTTPAYMNGH